MRPSSSIRRTWQTLAGVACLLDLSTVAAADAAPAAATYRHYLTGNPADVIRPTSGLLVLQGGGDDVDENYIQMGAKGGGGDFVVLRASGDTTNISKDTMLLHRNLVANILQAET